MALPAPQDPVDICNLSLSILSQGGEKGNYVSNIDTPTTNEEYLCKKHFPQQRRATLRGHPWNFAIKRVQLAASATAPIFGFSKAFDLPGDYIRFLTRHGDLGVPLAGAFIEGVDYEIEDGQFLTSSTTTTAAVLNMRYIFDQENMQKWDPLAVDVLVLNLALKLAPNFKSAPRTMNNIMDQLREKQAEAKAIDGQERPPRRIQRSKFIARRRGQCSSVASPFTIFK